VSREFAAVTTAVTSVALDITRIIHGPVPEAQRPKGVFPAQEHRTLKEALAFALTVADRYAFEIAGDDCRTAVMSDVYPAATSLVASFCGESPETASIVAEEVAAIGDQYGTLRHLYPGEGRDRPTVVEAAHSRLLATASEDQTPEFQAGVLAGMVEAVAAQRLPQAIEAGWAVRGIL